MQKSNESRPRQTIERRQTDYECRSSEEVAHRVDVRHVVVHPVVVLTPVAPLAATLIARAGAAAAAAGGAAVAARGRRRA